MSEQTLKRVDLIFGEYSNEKYKKIVALGVQNMIIINTPDALLICPRGESQKVKMLVEYLKTNQYTPFL